MQKPIEIAMREVGRAYNEETRNLNFLSTVELSVPDAIEVMEKYVPSYNEFTPKLLKKLPKNSTVRIGRECSVVIYVTTTQFEANATALSADEMSLHALQNDGKQIWRIWWD